MSVGDNGADDNDLAGIGGSMMDEMMPRIAQADAPSTDPPLTIEEAELDKTLGILDGCIGEVG